MNLEELRHIFSERIKDVRCRHYNQGQFADSVGVSRGAMSYYEKEARTADISVLRSICDVHNVSADFMLGIIADPKHEVADICDVTGLSPVSVRKLRIIQHLTKLGHLESLESTMDEFDEDFDDAMKLLAFTSVSDTLNLLLETDEGLNILNLLGLLISGNVELNTQDGVEPRVMLKSKVKGVEIAFPIENLSAALWVNIQEDAAILREKVITAQSDD
jgi:transcriptional regulator with XRE-family HTH domain